MTHWRASRAGWPRPSIPACVVIGDIIEDESGWWQVQEIRDGDVVLLGRDGEELIVSTDNHSRR